MAFSDIKFIQKATKLYVKTIQRIIKRIKAVDLESIRVMIATDYQI